MKWIIRNIIFLAIAFYGFQVIAQNSTAVTDIVSEILEDYQNISDIPLNGEVLFNDLYDVAQKPIPINSASKESLERLSFLSDYQIENILMYVYTSGPVLSLYELKAIPGVNEKTIRWLLPFIQLDEVVEENSNKKLYMRNDVIMRYVYVPEMAKGYRADSGNIYLGDRNATLLRLDGSLSNGISYHLLADKDKGEASYTDFLGGSIQYKGRGVVSRIILGDYKIRAGQGLLSWSGSILGKSMEPDLVRRKGETLSMYKSSVENGYYRGGAIQLNKSKLNLTLWGSKRKADATVDSTQNGKSIRTLLTSGYHNTTNTLHKKGNVELISGGGNLQYNNSWFRPGFTVLYNRLNLPILPNNDLSNLHLEHRNDWQQYSTDFFASIKNMHFWGELAYQSGDKYAGILGTTLYPSDALQASIIYRNYAPGFYSIYGNAFGESNKVQNEKGLFLGLKVVPHARITVSTSLDIYTFPWLRYQHNFSSEGYESFLRINYMHDSNQNIYLQLRYENRVKTVSAPTYPLGKLMDEQKSGVRLNYAVSHGNGWTTNSRVELSMHQLETFSSGILLMQDISYKPESAVLTGNIRLAWFQTDNYDARIYAYENDVLYAFSVPPYFGKGIRTYLNLKYMPFTFMECWLRLARVYYFDRETIGSGLDEINTNHRSEVKIQVRIKF